MILGLPTDYLWFWILVAATTFTVILVLFIPIYYLLSQILKELRNG